jgi:hypothetical protein
MPLPEFPSRELEPRKLSPEQAANPMSVLHALFDFAHLPQVREMLWDMLRAVVTGSFSSLSQDEKNDLMYFYEQLEKLVEAAHLLHKTDSDRRD